MKEVGNLKKEKQNMSVFCSVKAEIITVLLWKHILFILFVPQKFKVHNTKTLSGDL